MNFLLFFLFYIISTLILSIIFFVSYKLFFKKFIVSKISENALLSAFDSFNDKSILDINIDEKEKADQNEKIYTSF